MPSVYFFKCTNPYIFVLWDYVYGMNREGTGHIMVKICWWGLVFLMIFGFTILNKKKYIQKSSD